MDNKIIKVTRNMNILGRKTTHLLTLSSNMRFCRRLLGNVHMLYLGDEERQLKRNSLVYSSSQGIGDATLKSILDLLMQLRASQSDQNVFIQNNTVVKQQILSQLRNELTKVQDGLDNKQIQKLELVSNDLFDEKTINDLIKSLMEESKKKLASKSSDKSSKLDFSRKTGISISEHTSNIYTRLVNLQKGYREVITNTVEGLKTQRTVVKPPMINIRVQEDEGQEAPGKAKGFTVYPKKKGTDKVIGGNKALVNINKSYEQVRNLYTQKPSVISDIRSLKVTRDNIFNEKSNIKERSTKYTTKKNIYNNQQTLNETEISDESVRNISYNTELVNRIVKDQEEVEKVKESTLDVNEIVNKKEIIKKIENDIIKKFNINETVLVNETLKNNFVKIYSKAASKLLNKNITSNELENINTIDFDVNKILDIQNHRRQIKGIHNVKTHRQMINKYINKNVDVFNEQSQGTILSSSINEMLKKHNKLDSLLSENKETLRISDITQLINRTEHKDVDVQELSEILIKENQAKIEKELIKKRKNEVVDIYKEIKSIVSADEIHNQINKKLSKTIENVIKSTSRDKYSTTNQILRKNIKINNRIIDHKRSDIKLSDDQISGQLKKNYINDSVRINRKYDNQVVYSEELNKFTDINEKKSSLVNERTYVNVNKNVDHISENELLNESILEKSIIDKIKKHEKLVTLKNVKQTDNIIRQREYGIGERILKKNESIINEKVINEKARHATDKIINNIIKTNNIEEFVRTNTHLNTSISLQDGENIFIKNPLVMKKEINQTYDVENIVSRHISNFLAPKFSRNKILTENQSDIYRDTIKFNRSYYNDIKEDIGRTYLVNEKIISKDYGDSRQVIKGGIVHKEPISLDSLKEEKDAKSDNKDKKSLPSIRKPDYRERLTPPPNIQQPLVTSGAKAQKTLNEKDVERMIRSYMSNINIDSISSSVISRVESEMRLQMRRNGFI